MVRPVLRLPARVLKECAREVGERGDRALVTDLIDTMRASPACVGLAAPQIGVSRRVIVVDVTDHPKTTLCHGLVVLIDPYVVEATGKKIGREGCMSVPDLTANVARAETIVLAGRDAAGETRVIASEGFEARAFQHEIDHLDGALILDRVASITRDIFPRRTYR